MMVTCTCAVIHDGCMYPCCRHSDRHRDAVVAVNMFSGASSPGKGKQTCTHRAMMNGTVFLLSLMYITCVCCRDNGGDAVVAVNIFPGTSSPGKGKANIPNLQVKVIPPAESLPTGLGSVAGPSSPGERLSRSSGTGGLSGMSHSPISKPPSAFSPKTSMVLGAPGGLSPRGSQV